ncbi:porphobilinogen deaminase [Alphaproteobacteria bacterium]|nr:porphobilinogen deaminase [Alphaproteobacteria bacterium]
MSFPSSIRIGARKSPLAFAQAREVKDRLIEQWQSLTIEIVSFSTLGDRMLQGPLTEIGGKGLFTREIDESLLDERIDIAVHSMKDMPVELPDGLCLAATPERQDVRDAFLSKIAKDLDDLPKGAIVGTASLRRKAQILHHRPDLIVSPLRGNIETRMRKLEEGEVDAALLALAGLKRLGLENRAASILPVTRILPAVAQGAIAIVCRADDHRLKEALLAVNHAETLQRVTAERAFLRVLDGSCRTPIAGLAECSGGVLRLRGMALSPDGAEMRDGAAEGSPEEAQKIGETVAEHILNRLPPGFLAQS